MSASDATPDHARRRTALAPQRRPGKLRVAALMRAGAEVIAEHGYEAATMAEIAARAGAQVGSLYRFFPSKEALADALIERYNELIDNAFAEIDAVAAHATTDEFADALLHSLEGLRGETQSAMTTLLDARPDGSSHRKKFGEAFRAHIADALKRRAPHLPEDEAEAMGVVLLQNMKMMKTLDPARDAAAIAELATMTRLYLRSKLGERGI